jgi:hypothetical protein
MALTPIVANRSNVQQGVLRFIFGKNARHIAGLTTSMANKYRIVSF